MGLCVFVQQCLLGSFILCFKAAYQLQQLTKDCISPNSRPFLRWNQFQFKGSPVNAALKPSSSFYSPVAIGNPMKVKNLIL